MTWSVCTQWVRADAKDPPLCPQPRVASPHPHPHIPELLAEALGWSLESFGHLLRGRVKTLGSVFLKKKAPDRMGAGDMQKDSKGLKCGEGSEPSH